MRKMQAHLGVSVDGMWGVESMSAADGMEADDAWKAYQNNLLYRGGVVNPNDPRIMAFRESITLDAYELDREKKGWEEYGDFAAFMLKNDTTLTEVEKDYISTIYNLTEANFGAL